ncbi:MAG: hypothetical protein B7Z47_05670 [Chthoniobacter sp. 12-60-6]|nr:MAG: hypothetical protein B7Z47_05670 [Chthoniobacter sp. 12-60-6]
MHARLKAHHTRRMMTPLEQRLTQDNESLRVRLEAVVLENKLLREKVDLLVRKVFGRSSEALDDNQLMLLLQGEDQSAKKDPASSASPGALEAELARGGKELKARPARGERKPRIPEHLPVGEEIIVDPQEVQAGPAAWRQTGQEVTEQLDYTPARFCRRRIIRRKYARRDEPHRAPVIAKLDTLAERSLAAPGLLAQIIVAKYCDHLPLYRQEHIYRLRHGVGLPRQSLARWLMLAAQWLAPVYERIHTGVMAGGHVQTDETVVKYLEPGHGRTRQGYLWTLKQPQGDAVFVWLFTIIEACRRRRIDPWEYLRDVLTRLPSMTNRQIGEIMPDVWAKAQASEAGLGCRSSAARPMMARSQAAALGGCCDAYGRTHTC